MMLTNICQLYQQSQILALSATVANSDDIADWLGCELIESNWRPTKLIEGVYEDGNILMNDGSRFEILTSVGVTSAAIDIAIDSLKNGGQALIFADTRKRAFSLATKAAEAVYKVLDKSAQERTIELSSKILNKGDDTELTRNLSHLVAKGVAFHHAGLGPQVERLYNSHSKKG